MNTTQSISLLADAGGWAIVFEKNLLYFINRKTSHWYVVAFVTGLITLIFGMNGLMFGLTMPKFGLVAAIFFCVFGFLCKLAVGKINNNKIVLSADSNNIVAIIDLEKKILLNEKWEMLSSLDHVTFEYARQFGSSSNAIRARWDTGKKILIRGHPFAGGAGAFVDALKNKGIVMNNHPWLSRF